MNNRKFLTLLQREWLQHRNGWLMLVLIPIGLALLLTSFGQVQISSVDVANAGDAMAGMLAMGAMAGTAAVMFIIALMAALIIVAGVPRRDHGDRSIEFWLSLPASHTSSLAAPLLVHLVLMPAVALLAGWVGGWLLSIVLVSRVIGFGAWAALPWPLMLAGALSLVLRLLAGLPLALLWASPLILLVMVASAYFKRWGWVVLTVGLGLGGLLLDRVFGQPLVSTVTKGWLNHAATAFVNGGNGGLTVQGPGDATQALQHLPLWALYDWVAAVRELPSLLLLGGLVVSAGCFAGLVVWRQRGAGASA